MEVDAVRRTCAMVMDRASHVTLGDDTAFSQTASRLAEMISNNTLNVDWDADGWHYNADAASMGPLTAQYILVLDALNWCFWPSSTGMEYEHLACALKHVLAADHHAFDADRLQAVTPEQLRTWFGPQDVPELEERAEKLREVGRVLETHFHGLALNVVKRAMNSAAKLVDLMVAHFPGFRDQAVWKNRQVFFYKRAQIFVGDVWAAYGRQVLPFGEQDHDRPAAFYDMGKLTMFADYRVPQQLRADKLLIVTPELAGAIEAGTEIAPGSEEEVELRAGTVMAVEQLRDAMVSLGGSVTSVELDWLLWGLGEASKDELPAFHRTRTCFY